MKPVKISIAYVKKRGLLRAANLLLMICCGREARDRWRKICHNQLIGIASGLIHEKKLLGGRCDAGSDTFD
jgi:hypothetical protein